MQDLLLSPHLLWPMHVDIQEKAHSDWRRPPGPVGSGLHSPGSLGMWDHAQW